MLSAEIVVAGGGIAGLLIASELSKYCSVILLEQSASIPQNKYWLTDLDSYIVNPNLQHCVDIKYDKMEFIAYNGYNACICGDYCVWDTSKLTSHLISILKSNNVKIMNNYRLYSYSYTDNNINIRTNNITIRSKLLIDCMGYSSPLIGSKNIAAITGYYIMYGKKVLLKNNITPIGLDNVVLDKNPSYFELFPTSAGFAHAALILPCSKYYSQRDLEKELDFILFHSHYSGYICSESKDFQNYSGIIPVGRLRTLALDRIVFFGEAGQSNPAASATGLTRMLKTYKLLAQQLLKALSVDSVDKKGILSRIPVSMSKTNRVFQETLFERILHYNSDDFLRLVKDLNKYPDNIINDLIFAEYNFYNHRSLRYAIEALLSPNSVLGVNITDSIFRLLLRFR